MGRNINSQCNIIQPERRKFCIYISNLKKNKSQIVEKTLSGAGECRRSGKGGIKVQTFNYMRIKI